MNTLSIIIHQVGGPIPNTPPACSTHVLAIGTGCSCSCCVYMGWSVGKVGEEVGGGGLIDYKQSRKGDREGPERGERERERGRERERALTT